MTKVYTFLWASFFILTILSLLFDAFCLWFFQFRLAANMRPFPFKFSFFTPKGEFALADAYNEFIKEKYGKPSLLSRLFKMSFFVGFIFLGLAILFGKLASKAS